MWIIQGTLAWRTPPEDRWGDSGEIQCRSNFLFSLYGQLSLEHRFRFGLNGIVPFEPFFHVFPGGLEKAAINRISLILLSCLRKFKVGANSPNL
ncbi:hypothetical protein ACHQM5_028860 [Ranunculus cassubicifolius]